MGWSITPTTGVQNPDAQDGKYIFIPQLNDITYTITYTDDKGLEGTIQYTVKSTDCMVCDCNKFTLIPRVDTIPEDGYTTDTVIATINGYCVANGKTMDSYLNPVIVSGADMVKNISTAYTDDYTVSVYAKINPNPGDTRKFKIRFDIVNSYMVVKQSCDAEYEFTQAPNHCYVEEAPTVTPNVINNVPSAGGNYTVSYNTTECWVQEYVEYDQDIIELSAGPDDFDVLENKTANPRNTTINYGFRNTVSNELAIRPVEINQLANECVNAPEPSACFDIVQAECATYRTSDAAEQNIPVKFINMGDCWVYVSNRKDGKVIEVTADQTGSKFSITSNTDPSQATSHVYYTFKNTTTERTVEKPVTVIQSVNDCITAPEPTVCFDPIQQECTAYTTSSSDESQVSTKFTGVGDCWKYKTYTKNGNVKQNGVTVEGNNSVISLSANASASAVDSNVYYVFRNDIKGVEVTKAVKITQPAGCSCTCSDITKVLTEENMPSYTYTPDAQTNVPFAILTTASNFNCTITPNKKDNNITSIACTEYSASGSWSDDMKTYCNTFVSQGKKVFIIYGSLTAIPSGGGPRALGFTYSVCNNECKAPGNKPFYVYQRCACGMDNCRTEYTEEGQTVSVEDRPLFISSCYNEWSHGDSIYVTYLEVTGAAMFNLNSNREKEGPAVKSYTLPEPIWLRDDTKTTIPCTASGCLDPDARFNCKYDADAWSTIPPIVNQKEDSIYFNQPERFWDSTYNGILSQKVTFGDVPIEIFITGNRGTENYKPQPGKTWHCGMVQYAVKQEAKVPTNERLFEVYFRTHGGTITGGPDSGKCASDTFTASIMLAPKGQGYRGNDSEGLRVLSACCYCTDGLVISNVTPKQNLPANTNENERIEICRFNINKKCKIDVWGEFAGGDQTLLSFGSMDSNYDENTGLVILSAIVFKNITGSQKSLTIQMIVNGQECGGTFTVKQNA